MDRAAPVAHPANKVPALYRKTPLRLRMALRPDAVARPGLPSMGGDEAAGAGSMLRAQRLPPQRLVLIIDEATDKAVLQAAMGQALSKVRMVEVRRSREADRVFSAVIEASCKSCR